MQDPASELPRIPILGTSVNRARGRAGATMPGPTPLYGCERHSTLARWLTNSGWGTKLPARTVAIAAGTVLRAHRRRRPAEKTSSGGNAKAASTTPTTTTRPHAEPCACAVAEPDPTRCTTKAVGAVAATAVTGGAAGAANGSTCIRYAHRRRRGCGSLRGSGSGSLRGSGSGSLRGSGSGCLSRSGCGSRRSGLRLAGSADADESATALVDPRAVLPGPLTARSVGRSLTDAKRSQRAPDNGSTHQPERLTSREGAISQSSSEIIEEAFFSGHRLPPPIMAGLVSPAVLHNATTLAMLATRRTPK
jgi:hypothetical protein